MTNFAETLGALCGMRSWLLGLRFLGDTGCASSAIDLCTPCEGACDGETCYSQALGIEVPLVLRVTVSGAFNSLTTECPADGYRGVFLIRLSTDSAVSQVAIWSGSICGVSVSFQIRRVTRWRCNVGAVGIWQHAIFFDWPGYNQKSHIEFYEDPTVELTLGPDNQTSYVHCPTNNDKHYWDCAWGTPLNCTEGKYHGYGNGAFCFIPGGSAEDGSEYPDCSMSAVIEAASYEETQACCQHGHYCPDFLIADTEEDLIDGMCCATVSVTGIERDERECYFGYPASGATAGFAGTYKHVGCGKWVAKHSTCNNPHPNILTLTPVYATVNGIQTLTRWKLTLYGGERIAVAESSDAAAVGVSFSGETDDADVSACQSRPTKEWLDTIGFLVTDASYDPGLYGVDYSNAQVSVSFGGSWDDCSDEGVDAPDLDVWGWRLTYTDTRGIPGSLVFAPQGGLTWANGLSTWQLVGDRSTRPGAILLALKGSCSRLGFNHGWCIDSAWTGQPITCKVAELIVEDVARWNYMLCGFLPGSAVTLEPLFTAPDPSEGSVCEVAAWELLWGSDEEAASVTLSWDAVNSRWSWEPSAHQVYRLTREEDGRNGEGNYTLSIEVVYDIAAIDTASKAFTIASESPWEFAAGTLLVVANSGDNDGTYTVVSATQSGSDLIIEVAEAIESATVAGTIEKSLSDSITTGAAVHCCYAGQLDVSLGTGETAILTAGGPWMEDRYTGCPSKCDASSWSMSVTLLGGAGTKTGTLQYYPALASWWQISGSQLMCIVRLSDVGAQATYMAYLTYVIDEANVGYAHCKFTVWGDDCCSGTPTYDTPVGATSFSVSASGCPA